MKEAKYEDLYRSGKTSKDIWQYIPDRFENAVEEVNVDSDGYWIYLNEDDGWRAYDGEPDCGIIHEYTIADLKAAIKTIRQYKKGTEQS